MRHFILILLVALLPALAGCGKSEKAAAPTAQEKQFSKMVLDAKPMADKGIAEAQLVLGLAYAMGKGALQDFKEAMKWYRLAANQAHSDAQYNLALMFGQGRGVPQEYVQAHMLVSVAIATATDGKKKKDYLKTLESVVALMTAAQITEAEELAKKCAAGKYKGCVASG